jgi:hypothetical protein
MRSPFELKAPAPQAVPPGFIMGKLDAHAASRKAMLTTTKPPVKNLISRFIVCFPFLPPTQ